MATCFSTYLSTWGSPAANCTAYVPSRASQRPHFRLVFLYGRLRRPTCRHIFLRGRRRRPIFGIFVLCVRRHFSICCSAWASRPETSFSAQQSICQRFERRHNKSYPKVASARILEVTHREIGDIHSFPKGVEQLPAVALARTLWLPARVGVSAERRPSPWLKAQGSRPFGSRKALHLHP